MSASDVGLDPTDYFPNAEFHDVYCPHLGLQLGPCSECDSIAYLAWCEESYEEMLAEHGGYDVRFEIPEPLPFEHIPTMEVQR